ncbi:hypothetical protein [Dongia sedimenti]|uniref:Lysozyme inhibitor LprI N-terminal domain-containing protein n=1 Tax=Dongia sedimenti TaxID=3064282 RepID=A0ABU0YTW2_9PROT|nr:hypothetical protein [Rhodospirillaceae bacterium R-7]
MLKYFATAALTLISLPALADATGAGFCTVMHEGVTACSEEIAATKVRRCPNAIADVKASYDATKDEPSKAMRAELQNANAMWLAVAQQPTKERLKGANAAIEKSCVKLKKLDQ